MVQLPYQVGQIAATQKRIFFCKPEEVIQSSEYACLSLSLSFINPFSCICSQGPNFKAGNYGPKPVDVNMSGNQFHCKNK